MGDEHALGMDVHHLGALFVGHQDLVEVLRWVAPLGEAFPAGDELVLGQGVRGRIFRVVKAADDEGPVGITIFKRHHRVR